LNDRRASNRAIRIITFDFFDTLVFHRDGRGRGASLIEYLEHQGLEPAPWRHEVLYEVFDSETAEAYSRASAEENGNRRALLVERVFQSLGLSLADRAIERHMSPILEILGPESFDVFPDAPRVLRVLDSMGYRLAIISNWPWGLRHFCDALALSGYFEFIFASAEVGAAKPDNAIFAEAAARLGVEPSQVLHVGDSLTNDYLGARDSGFGALLVDRAGARQVPAEQLITSLDELPARLQGKSVLASVGANACRCDVGPCGIDG
jgi:HAD superfamily hydrolase (TIGR01549 family)